MKQIRAPHQRRITITLVGLCALSLALAASAGAAAFPDQAAVHLPSDEVGAQASVNIPAAPVGAPAAVWLAPAALLHDNGPLITDLGAGAGGLDVSAVQEAVGNTAFGKNAGVSGDFRLADDFTVPAGGWTVDTITFFAYQTGSGNASTMSEVNLRIWDGPPDDPASAVVFGDTVTNRMDSTAFTNIYRTGSADLANAGRPIMAIVATVNTVLPAGTYWVDWQLDGTVASGPWVPPVTLPGQTHKPGSNGLQWDGADWILNDDSGSGTPQDSPFVIDGVAGVVAADPPALVPANSWQVLLLLAGLLLGGAWFGVRRSWG